MLWNSQSTPIHKISKQHTDKNHWEENYFMQSVTYVDVFVLLTIIQIYPQTYNADSENNGCWPQWTNLISRTVHVFRRNQTNHLLRSNNVFLFSRSYQRLVKVKQCSFQDQIMSFFGSNLKSQSTQFSRKILLYK